MNRHSQQIVQKLWNYCKVLRDDGLSYGDCVEQLSCLLFLKTADECSKPPFTKPSSVRNRYRMSRGGQGASLSGEAAITGVGKPAKVTAVVTGQCRSTMDVYA